MTGKPESLESVLSRLLNSLGLPTPDLLPRLRESWDELAGPPWAGQSSPVLVRRGELVVESASAQLVSILRYASGELLRRLDDEFGPGKIDTIRVAGPRR
ncbi:MAG: DciA family protein [Acidimicrobiia bacterium]